MVKYSACALHAYTFFLHPLSKIPVSAPEYSPHLYYHFVDSTMHEVIKVTLK